MKSYTKTVPLYVQTVRQSTVEQIAPFLDPGQDVVVSMEQTRLRWGVGCGWVWVCGWQVVVVVVAMQWSWW